MYYFLVYFIKVQLVMLISVPFAFSSSTFIEGSKWWLNYNSSQVLMKLLTKSTNSNNEIVYALQIGNKRGSLISMQSPKSGIEHIRLSINTKGKPILCRGSVIYGAKKSIIAGTCDKHMGLGSFYAERKVNSTNIQSNNECSANLKKAQEAYKNTLKELWDEQDNCKKSLSKNTRLQFSSSFSGYPATKGSNPKSDNVMKNIYPSQPPKTSLENKWLKAHNSELYRVVMASLSKSEQTQFPRWEKEMCGNIHNPYCKATARQKIIACSKGVGC